MIEKDVYTINIDGDNCIVLDEIKISDVTYVYLVNEKDDKDFFVNKIVVEDNEEYLTGLDSEDEVKKAMQAYVEKNANLNN